MIKKQFFGTAVELSPEQQQAVDLWKVAQMTYSNECKLFQRIRRATPPLVIQTILQHTTYELARDRYKQACKDYERARTAFIGVINPARALANEAIEKMRSYIATLDASAVPTVKEIREKEKQQDRYGEDPQAQALLRRMRTAQFQEVVNEQTADSELEITLHNSE